MRRLQEDLVEERALRRTAAEEPKVPSPGYTHASPIPTVARAEGLQCQQSVHGGLFEVVLVPLDQSLIHHQVYPRRFHVRLSHVVPERRGRAASLLPVALVVDLQPFSTTLAVFLREGGTFLASVPATRAATRHKRERGSDPDGRTTT